jgi:hypothetical protein
VQEKAPNVDDTEGSHPILDPVPQTESGVVNGNIQINMGAQVGSPKCSDVCITIFICLELRTNFILFV